jgi:Ca-activated chloride channel family protein
VTAWQRGCGAVGLAALALAPAGAAQSPTFSARVDSVSLDVSVTRNRAPVHGLTADDFELFDNGVPQQIDSIGFDDVPVNVMLALDMSGSVQGPRLEQLRRAALALFSGLAPGDHGGLLGFSERVIVRSGFTADRQLLMTGLQRPVAGGDTALYDAVYTAMVLGDDQAGRPLVIVFSDGADTASFLTSTLVLDAARRLRPAVYAVTSTGVRDDFLNDLVRATGGRRLDIGSIDRLSETFGQILTESRQRYLIGFTPEGVEGPGWHELTVRVRGRTDVVISARPGYVAGP